MNRYFKRTETGDFQHYINDELRATIEAKNLNDYKEYGGYENDPVIE